MSLFKQLAGETVVYGFSHMLGKVLNYVLIAFYLTRKLSNQQAEYGIYNELYFYVALLLILFGLRMETTFFRFGSEQESYKKAFSNGLASMTGLALIWLVPAFIFSDQIAQLLSYPDKGIYIRILSALITTDLIIAMPMARFRLDRRPLRFALLQTGSIILNITLVLFFLEVCPAMGWSGLFHEGDLLVDVFLANLIARLVLLIILLPNVIKLGWHFDFLIWKKMLNYAWPLVLVGIAGVINQSSYIILQKYFLGGEMLDNLSTGGIYAAAAKIALLMSLFVTAYNFAAEPFFFGQARRADANYIYAEMARAFSWVASFILLGLLLFMDVFENIVDASYRETMYVVPIILVGYFFLGLYYNLAIWYKVTDRTYFGTIISGVGTILTLLINLILLPQIGILASAYAALACYLSMSVLCYLLGQKYLKVPYNVGRIMAGLVLALGLFFLYNQYFPEMSISLSWIVRLVILAIFILAVWLLEKEKIREWLTYS
jgi:O-antigen/teichoic acid export membrane protein